MVQIKLQTKAGSYCWDKKQRAAVSLGIYKQCVGISCFFFPSGPEALLVKVGLLRAVMHLANGEE